MNMLTDLFKMLFLAAYCLSFSACLNYLPEENTHEPGDIPVSLSTRLRQSPTRITEINFEESESIGLYIMVQPSTIDKTRYIDNRRFTNTPDKGFVADEAVFFPEGKSICDFIGYYPYKSNAVGKGESVIQVEVHTDQTSKSAISASDFLVATAKGVSSSAKPIELLFDHKLSRLNIQLKPESGHTVETLRDANPVIKIKNVYTKSSYDFTIDNFINPNTKADIIPYGNWEIKDGVLCGKSAIIIPQTLPESHILLELDIDGKILECELDEAHTFASGVTEENTITILSSGDAIKSTITGNINGWETLQKDLNAKQVPTSIYLPDLTFKESNVYKVMNREKQIAEICLEYLCGDNIEAKAIVIYPVKNGLTDLSCGLVAELKDKSGEIHGGSISWSTSSNTMSYLAGNSTPIEFIYISEDGEIKTTRPENALQLQVRPDVLTDIRSTETFIYPLVKIGTQYWTRMNFKATKYLDGSSIELGSVVSSAAQYYTYSNAYFFYNQVVIATGKLIPDGWRVSNETDIINLKTYIKNNAAVLKNGQSWNSNNNSPVSNLTGLNIAATGYFDETYTFNGTYGAIWCTNNTNPDLAEKSLILNANNNLVEIKPATTDMAFAIRCIRN